MSALSNLVKYQKGQGKPLPTYRMQQKLKLLVSLCALQVICQLQ